MGSAFAKEALTIKCEEIVAAAAEMLDWDKFEETSGNLTQGERDCLETLIPQLNIAAELFRQCAKNKGARSEAVREGV
jgi:hypothetical protein